MLFVNTGCCRSPPWDTSYYHLRWRWNWLIWIYVHHFTVITILPLSQSFQITHTTVNMQAALECHKMPHRVCHQWSYNMYNIWMCHTHLYLMLNLNLPSNHLDPWAHSTGDSTFSCLRQITEEFCWNPNLISAFAHIMKTSFWLTHFQAPSPQTWGRVVATYHKWCRQHVDTV